MSEKNQAFHRLAEKRVESIADALRIFSNLSGPSYEWAPNEVMAYVRQIEAAKDTMLARFTETKRWHATTAAPDLPDPPGQDEEDGETLSVVEEDVVVETKGQKRARLLTEILAGQNDREALAEMVALQREVIEKLQAELDQGRKS